MSLEAAEETSRSDYRKSVKKSGLLSGGGLGFTIGKQSQKSTNELDSVSQAGSVVGSTGGNVTLEAGKDVAVTASDIISGQDTTITGQNVTIQAADNTDKEHDTYQFKQSGLSVSLGGRAIRDKGTGSLSLEAAEETSRSDYRKSVKKSGLLSGGGLGFTIGKQSQKSTNELDSVSQAGSVVGSTGGNVTLEAGKDVAVTASDIISGQDTTITGQNVTIQAAKRATEVEDSRLKALYDYKAVKAVDNLSKGKNADGSDPKGGGLSVSVSLGTTKQQSETNAEAVTAAPSQVTAGGDVNITATGVKDKDGQVIDGGDLNIIGSTVDGKNIHLKAANDVNLIAADNTTQSETTNSGKSASIGVSLSQGQAPGFFLGGNKSKGNENGNTLTHTNTQITATDTVTIESGEDTNLKGAQVKGKTVNVKADGDLNLESLQDEDNYKETNKSAGATINFGVGGVSGTGSASKGKIDSEYRSVTEQTGIYAGEGGFDITVGKNTDLKGAVIEAPAGKNKLSTDTLTYSDIENHADYNASSSGYTLNTVTTLKDGGKDKDGNPTFISEKNLSVAPDIGMPVSGSASSTTKSTIAEGTIEVRSNPNQDLSNLNRNTDQALNTLGKIFDKKTVQEKQELTKVFGQEAYGAIGDLALKQYKKALADEEAAEKSGNKTAYEEAKARADSWSDGGTNKILLHAVAGGIMSSLSGGSFASGATGAGLNEAVQNELAKIKDPGLHQLASAAIGAVASKLVGGNAQTGASAAMSGTKYNWLDHYQQQAMLMALEAAGDDKEKRKEIYAYYAALSQYNIDHYGQNFETIERELLSQFHHDTADTSGGLNLSLNQITGYYQGYDFANYYRAKLEENKNYLPSIIDNFDYSQGRRYDTQDNLKPSSDPVNTNIRTANNLVATGAPIVQGSDGIKYVRQINTDGTYTDYKVPNQDSVTVNSNVQKAFELQAAGAPVYLDPSGKGKFVRELHQDGTFQDYYLPNPYAAVTYQPVASGSGITFEFEKNTEIHATTPEEAANNYNRVKDFMDNKLGPLITGVSQGKTVQSDFVEDNPQGTPIKIWDANLHEITLVQKDDGTIVWSASEYNKEITYLKQNESEASNLLTKFSMVDPGALAGKTEPVLPKLEGPSKAVDDILKGLPLVESQKVKQVSGKNQVGTIRLWMTLIAWVYKMSETYQAVR